MYILLLRHLRVESDEVVPVCRAAYPEEIEDLLDNEFVGQYLDGGDVKYYRQGGPLEMFEPPDGETPHIKDVGTPKRWKAHSELEYNQKVLSLPEAQDLEDGLKPGKLH